MTTFSIIKCFDTGPDKKKIEGKIVHILLSFSLNMCFGYLKEHMFWFGDKKIMDIKTDGGTYVQTDRGYT